MSDLVQRLRKRSTDEPFRRGDPALYAEAADRIEQQDAELAELRKLKAGLARTILRLQAVVADAEGALNRASDD